MLSSRTRLPKLPVVCSGLVIAALQRFYDLPYESRAGCSTGPFRARDPTQGANIDTTAALIVPKLRETPLLLPRSTSEDRDCAPRIQRCSHFKVNHVSASGLRPANHMTLRRVNDTGKRLAPRRRQVQDERLLGGHSGPIGRPTYSRDPKARTVGWASTVLPGV